MDQKVIKILVVEDSAVSREFLVHLLRSDPQLRVIGAVGSGEAALDFIQAQKPDVVTMDINLPKMNGFETTRQIMEQSPTPVVIVTATSNPREVATTFQAIEAGALAVLQIPAGFGHPDHKATVTELIRTVKSMAEVRVVRRWSRSKSSGRTPLPEPPPLRTQNGTRIVAIGASTGGPVVLQSILSLLPGTFSVPLVVVQHIAPGFVHGFVEWLSRSCQVVVEVASHPMSMAPGHVYVAPDNQHMVVGTGDRILLRNDPPENGLRPAVSSLFRSVAEVYGRHGMGIILTGMGRDGADELKQIKEAGGITIAQSEETCAINGMPGEAVKRNAATYILPPEKIAQALRNLMSHDGKH